MPLNVKHHSQTENRGKLIKNQVSKFRGSKAQLLVLSLLRPLFIWKPHAEVQSFIPLNGKDHNSKQRIETRFPNYFYTLSYLHVRK